MGIAEILSYYIFLSELTLVFKGGSKCLNLDSVDKITGTTLRCDCEDLHIQGFLSGACPKNYKSFPAESNDLKLADWCQ